MWPFRLPSPEHVKAKQLELARLALIDAEFALEHYASQVALLRSRILRLEANQRGRGHDAPRT
jgi:hypothetical protein